jgi:hypothetical protein
MTSTTQLASNRQNSLLSTGPRSDAGKIASSKNAISHGLSAADPVLAYENRGDYEKLVSDYTSEYEPDTIHQTFLVSQLAGARWRLDRIQRIENAAIDLIIGAPGEITDSPDHKIAQRMLDSGGDPLPRLERYRASVERSYHRAIKELRTAQIQQIQDEIGWPRLVTPGDENERQAGVSCQQREETAESGNGALCGPKTKLAKLT